jgi:hypothetical protein
MARCGDRPYGEGRTALPVSPGTHDAWGMADQKNAWDDVSARFTGLAMKLWYHLEQSHEQPEDGEASRTVLHSFAGAIEDAIEAAGAAARDPAVRQDVRDAGAALAEAISGTFAQVGADLRSAVRTPPAG